MAYDHFTLVTPNIAYFKVRDVPIEKRIDYIDSTFVDWDHYWKAISNVHQHFCVVMDISELKQTHKASRDHMVMRLKKINDTYPGTWVGVILVASSMLTRGIATAYSWIAPTFPGVEVKAMASVEEATQRARELLETAHRRGHG